MRNEFGQTLLLLIVIMTVALAVGLSIIQKSISDVSTASKVEQSSRAFSAAEAGIEQALQNQVAGPQTVDFSTSNKSSAQVNLTSKPAMLASGYQEAIQYPALAKEDIVQVWLADPDHNDANGRPLEFYKQNTLDIYWGNSTTDKAAIELTLVYNEGGVYKANKWYKDSDSARTVNNGFSTADVTCSGYPLSSVSGSSVFYQCKTVLRNLPSTGQMLLRARLLYNTSSQPLAIQAVNSNCGTNSCKLPPQAREITSTGTSGETQRTVRVFQENNVVPFYYDYGIFSTSSIEK